MVGHSTWGEIEGRDDGAFRMGRDGGVFSMGRDGGAFRMGRNGGAFSTGKKRWWGLQHGEEEMVGPSAWGRDGRAFNAGDEWGWRSLQHVHGVEMEGSLAQGDGSVFSVYMYRG